MFDLFSFPEQGPMPDDRGRFDAATGRAFNRLARSTGPGWQVGADGIHQDEPQQPFVLARVTQVLSHGGVNRHGWHEVVFKGAEARTRFPGGFSGTVAGDDWAAHPDNQAVPAGRFVFVSRDKWGRWLLFTAEDAYPYGPYSKAGPFGTRRISIPIYRYTCSGGNLMETGYTYTFSGGAPLVITSGTTGGGTSPPPPPPPPPPSGCPEGLEFRYVCNQGICVGDCYEPGAGYANLSDCQAACGS